MNDSQLLHCCDHIRANLLLKVSIFQLFLVTAQKFAKAEPSEFIARFSNSDDQ